jgi:hypothetical protein
VVSLVGQSKRYRYTSLADFFCLLHGITVSDFWLLLGIAMESLLAFDVVQTIVQTI